MHRYRIRNMRKNKDGAIGIGTLIVFIAMILVAAIAAAVIISAVFSLQQQAENAASGAKNKVSNALQVRLIEGVRTGTPLNNTIDYLQIQVSLAPGSSAINMADVIIKVVTEKKEKDLSLNQYVFPGPNPETQYLTDAQALSLADSTHYAAEEVPGGQLSSGWDPYITPSHPNPSYFLAEGNILKIWIDLRGGGEGIGSQLSPSTYCKISFIITTGGFDTFETFTTPPSYDTAAIIDLTSR
ncbi:MAG: archaellin/type IV pilin N-terminal domain-containing protein [Thermoplasmata archaeon]